MRWGGPIPDGIQPGWALEGYSIRQGTFILGVLIWSHFEWAFSDP
jgi:hypothetical protein